MPLTIGNHVFPSDLIILESQGLDVILGMDWLSMYGGNIDCASKSIMLTTPKGKRIKYVSRHAPRRTQVNSFSGDVQEEVPVVKAVLGISCSRIFGWWYPDRKSILENTLAPCS